MPRIAATVGLAGTAYEALKDMLEIDDVQSECTNLFPQGTHYCQRRQRKYSWWRSQQAAVRRYGEAAQMEPGVVQDTLQHVAAFARYLRKQVHFGSELRHFLLDFDADEVRVEHARLQAMLDKKAEARQAQMQGQGESSSKQASAWRWWRCCL